MTHKEKFKPPHPGELILEDCMKPLQLTIVEASSALKTSRKNLSTLLHGRIGISADMAIRLAQVFGSTPKFWLDLQANYDLAHAESRLKKWKPARTYIGAEART